MRRGAEISLVLDEKIRVSKPLSLWGRRMEVGFFTSIELTLTEEY
jgi:hypothetical protein